MTALIESRLAVIRLWMIVNQGAKQKKPDEWREDAVDGEGHVYKVAGGERKDAIGVGSLRALSMSAQ